MTQINKLLANKIQIYLKSQVKLPSDQETFAYYITIAHFFPGKIQDSISESSCLTLIFGVSFTCTNQAQQMLTILQV